MNDCNLCRRAILAEPRGSSADVRLHLNSCSECARFAEQARLFENRLDRALRVDLSQDAGDSRRRNSHTHWVGSTWQRRRWVAAAASVLLASVVAGSLWVVAPGASLAADVVSHMAEEPNAWARTEVPVSAARMAAILDESHIRLKADAGLVTYANSCLFRGHRVPHLVVQTDAGPVTVMVLAHEHTLVRQRFDDQGYRGVIEGIPGHGSLAVLERGTSFDERTLAAVIAQMQAALQWFG